MRLFPAAATRFGFAELLAAMRPALSGSITPDFVKSLAARLGLADGVALSSLMRNTWAVMTVLKAEFGPEAEVILPRYCCPSFIHGIQAAGTPHRYCDIDPTTLCVTPELIDRVRTPRSRALLVPNLFGLCADMVALEGYCRDHGLCLIDGADYSLGGRFAGRPLGGFGDFAILNFQEGKALPIGGGMALSRMPGRLRQLAAARSASSLVAFARSAAFCLLIRPAAYGGFSRCLGLMGVAKKRFSMEDTIRTTRQEFDFKIADADAGRMISRYQSALGLTLLASLETQMHARIHHARILESGLAGLRGLALVPRHPLLEICHYLRYPVLVADGRRDDLCAVLTRQGFEASRMYVEHGMHIRDDEFPGAARVCRDLLTLPCHAFMTATDVERLAGAVRDFLK